MALTLLAGPANAGKVALLLERYLADLDREPILIVPNRSDVDRVEREIRRNPRRYVAQETIALSRHPTVCGSRLEPRHVDLRPFVLTAGDDVSVIPGGLTRVAFDAGALVVNSSQQGGGKDTWVVE